MVCEYAVLTGLIKQQNITGNCSGPGVFGQYLLKKKKEETPLRTDVRSCLQGSLFCSKSFARSDSRL